MEFRLCRELGCLPSALESLPSDLVETWQTILAAEGEADEWTMKQGELETKRRNQKGR